MGLFGKKKQKTEGAMVLRGFPGDSSTNKCLLMAAEQGLLLETQLVDVTEGACESPEYRSLSPFGKVPCLKDGDFVISGAPAVLSYMGIKGKGGSLNPKKASILGEQDYWVDIARTVVGPQVRTIMQEKVVKGMADETAQPDQATVDAARTALAPALDALDARLAGGRFIVGEYSYADVHWTACVHLLTVAGQGDLIERRGNLRAWLGRIRQHKSFSGQNLLAYDLLPSLEDIKALRMKDLVITDF